MAFLRLQATTFTTMRPPHRYLAGLGCNGMWRPLNTLGCPVLSMPHILEATSSEQTNYGECLGIQI